MIKMTIISDIHANLPALEEVLSAIKRQQGGKIYCLGDVVNQNVWNNEVIELLMKHKIPVVQGNHDEGIASGRKDFSFSYSSHETKLWGREAILHTLSQISVENRNILAGYPKEMKLTYVSQNGNPLRLFLTHGIPGDFTKRLYRFLPRRYFAELLNDVDADVLVTGNTHSPYHVVIPVESEEGTVYKHAINPGAVGKCSDGDWRASYAIVTLHDETDWHKDPRAVQVDFYRLTYDLDKAVKAIQHSPLPLVYAGYLIGG